MYLTKSDRLGLETSTVINFEKVAEDLLMVSINHDTSDQSKMFSYWRLLGDGKNPPLEIGINTKKKTLKSITFFLDNSCFKKFTIPDADSLQGGLLVNTEMFHTENSYVNQNGQYNVSLMDNKFVCIFDDIYNIKKGIRNGRIEFLLNEKDDLCGFAVCSLEKSEKKKIRSLQDSRL